MGWIENPEAWSKYKLREHKDIQQAKSRHLFYCSWCGRKLDPSGKCSQCKEDYREKEYDPERPLYKCPYCQQNIIKVGFYCPLCGEKIE